jgi:hypothetical protein
MLKNKNLKMAVYCAVAPCSLEEVYRRFRGTCYLYHQGAETSVNFYQTTWHNNPEDSHLHIRRREKSEISLNKNLTVSFYYLHDIRVEFVVL